MATLLAGVAPVGASDNYKHDHVNCGLIPQRGISPRGLLKPCGGNDGYYCMGEQVGLESNELTIFTFDLC